MYFETKNNKNVVNIQTSAGGAVARYISLQGKIGVASHDPSSYSAGVLLFYFINREQHHCFIKKENAFDCVSKC